jgi:hypothetical protein
MTPTSVARNSEPEFVTDWRVVFAIIGILVLMAAGFFVWTWSLPPATRTALRIQAIPRETNSDEQPQAVTETANGTIPDLEVVLPWAPSAREIAAGPISRE